MNEKSVFLSISICLFFLCNTLTAHTIIKHLDSIKLSEEIKDHVKSLKLTSEEPKKPITAQEIILTKGLSYKKYTLEDSYKYNKKDREFQWEKIKEQLAYIVNFQKENNNYAVLVNYKNQNGRAPLVRNYTKNNYNSISDSLGTDRSQSVPLYYIGEPKTPIIYGRDGSLVKILSADTAKILKIKGLTNVKGEWEVPKKYVKNINDSVTFKKVVIVDRTNQNICTLEQKSDKEWVILSMNPSTTGRYNPPFGKTTPLGIFIVQEQKSKMFYLKDGTNTIQGFAPWASRFTNGAYLHGVPVPNPKGALVEYSYSLGTTPRSHMCVRNATSHAKFIYDWLKPYSSLVIVID